MIIKIQGGLGNQMFQYACGRNLELSGKKIIFDTSFFNGDKAKKDTARNFKLNNFDIKTKAKFSNKKYLIINIINKIKRKLGFKQEFFYQSEKYFKNIKNIIHKEFTLKNSLAKESLMWQEKISMTENSVSLHIRRGDYVQKKETNAFHGTCDIQYYKKAIEKITEILKNKNIEIFVFSDDIDWAKENLLLSYPTHFVSDPQIPDYEEIFLISLCRHNIIANSTFSWWGAWLNKNSNKIIMAPKQWTVAKTSDELDILPINWIKI
ncbi:MAG: alpha-1,2-fucosyltransferase [Patescibacteria group bacterium]